MTQRDHFELALQFDTEALEGLNRSSSLTNEEFIEAVIMNAFGGAVVAISIRRDYYSEGCDREEPVE